MNLGSKSSASGALSTSYAAFELAELPLQMRAGVVALELDTVVTATQVLWYLSADADGDVPLMPVQTSTIVGRTSGKGGVGNSLENSPLATWKVSGKLWVQAKLDGGTANCVAHFAWGA